MAAKYRNKANHKTKCQRVKVKPKKKERKGKKINQQISFASICQQVERELKGKKWLKMATSVIYDMQLIRQMENIRENGSGQANNLGK